MSGNRMSVENIEASIDKMIGNVTDDNTQDNNAQANEEADASTDGAEADTQRQEASQRGADQRGAGDKDNRAADGNGQPSQQRQAPPKRNPGDLVDASGNVIARAGAERRHYETAQRATRELQQTQQRMTALEAEVNAYRTAATMPQQLGLDVAEQTTAMQFMAHWKRDPVGAAKKMLGELQAAGYTIEELRGGTDVFAIKKMIDETIAPFRQDREQQAKQQEAAQAVQREIEEVYNEFPWAPVQEQSLTALLDVYPNDNLRMIAVRLEAWADKHGFDITQPLPPQVEARKAAARQQTQQQQQPNNARGPSGAGAASATPRRNSSVGRTNRDIVREAMLEHGIELPN